MGSRANLRAVLALVVALLGCTPYIAWPEAPAEPAWTIEAVEQDCFAGDVSACRDAIDHHRRGTITYFDRKRAVELSAHACSLGELDACHLAAVDEEALGRIDAAHARFVDACARGHAQSCEVLREEEVVRALDVHVELWRCARFVGAAGYGLQVHLWGSLWSPAAGEAARISFRSDHAILQPCVNRAVASMRFAPVPAAMHFAYDLDIERETVARKLAELAPGGLLPIDDAHDRFTPSSCPPELGRRCASLPIETLMGDALYTPEPSRDELAAGWRETVWVNHVPRPLRVSLDFCVDPKTGRTSRIRRTRPGRGQPIVDQLMSKLARWRFRPVEVDGEATLVCSRIDYAVDWIFGVKLRVTKGWLPVSALPAAPEPATITPARAISTPMPSSAALRRSRSGREGNRVVRNKTAYCIDEHGGVLDVKTTRRSFRDPKLDAVLRSAIKRWRFSPLLIDGQPRKSCNEQTFRIVFNRVD